MPVLFRLAGHTRKVVCTLRINVSGLNAAIMGYEQNILSLRHMLTVSEYVYVSDDSLCTEPASNAGHTGPLQPATITAPRTDSEFQYNNGIPSTFNPSSGFAIEDNDHFPVDTYVAASMAYTVLEQMTTIISGSRQQNAQIVSQNETISQQSQQISQQNTTITSLEGQIQDLRNEIAQLRTFVLSFSQSLRTQSRPEAPAVPMEIDSASSDESNSDESNRGTWGSDGSNEWRTNGDGHSSRTPADMLANLSASKSRAQKRNSSAKDSGYGTN